MKKSEQATRVRAISAYLEGIGQPVSNVQCYEILARALGLKNKHVLASLGKEDNKATAPGVPTTVTLDGEAVPVRAVGAKPYTVEEMKALDWEFDVVIPLDLGELEAGDIERQNELASEFITGNDCALENIGYDHVPEVCYGKGYVAYRVTGHISQPAEFFSEIEEEEDARFYAELKDFASLIREEGAVCVRTSEGPQSMVIRNVNWVLIDLLTAYAKSAGDNNDEVIAQSSQPVMELHWKYAAAEGVPAVLGDLKYVSKMSNDEWHLPLHGGSVRLTFNS